jgi:hypothetical protein
MAFSLSLQSPATSPNQCISPSMDIDSSFHSICASRLSLFYPFLFPRWPFDGMRWTQLDICIFSTLSSIFGSICAQCSMGSQATRIQRARLAMSSGRCSRKELINPSFRSLLHRSALEEGMILGALIQGKVMKNEVGSNQIQKPTDFLIAETIGRSASWSKSL